MLHIDSVGLTINRFGEPFEGPAHMLVFRPGLGVTSFTDLECWRLQGGPSADVHYHKYVAVNPNASYEDLCGAAGDAMSFVFTELVAERTTRRRLATASRLPPSARGSC